MSLDQNIDTTSFESGSGWQEVSASTATASTNSQFQIQFDQFVQEMLSHGYVLLYTKGQHVSGSLRYMLKFSQIEKGFAAQGLTYMHVTGVEITEQSLNGTKVGDRLLRSDKVPEITGIIQIIDQRRSVLEQYEDE